MTVKIRQKANKTPSNFDTDARDDSRDVCHVKPKNKRIMDKTYTLTPQQQGVIIDALRDRIGKLYNIAELYTDNTDAKKDCMNEVRIVKEVLEVFETK